MATSARHRRRLINSSEPPRTTDLPAARCSSPAATGNEAVDECVSDWIDRDVKKKRRRRRRRRKTSGLLFPRTRAAFDSFGATAPACHDVLGRMILERLRSRCYEGAHLATSSKTARLSMARGQMQGPSRRLGSSSIRSSLYATTRND